MIVKGLEYKSIVLEPFCIQRNKGVIPSELDNGKLKNLALQNEPQGKTGLRRLITKFLEYA